jgi:chemotaxis protein methyltransferase CheR
MRVASSISVPTTEMFRDPQLFKMVREVVLPKLKEADVLRAWSAGCATGEETYSLAILLKEEGLFDRARIYATDLHEGIIQRARQGVFPLRSMQTYTRNYQLSGGKHDFSKYYTSGYDRALFRSSLKRHITFACHSLVSDSSFNEFDLILCRNVMLYFNLELRKRVHTLLYESLRVGGFLAVGDKETITDSPHAKAYAVVSKELKLYQRIR